MAYNRPLLAMWERTTRWLTVANSGFIFSLGKVRLLVQSFSRPSKVLPSSHMGPGTWLGSGRNYLSTNTELWCLSKRQPWICQTVYSVEYNPLWDLNELWSFDSIQGSILYNVIVMYDPWSILLSWIPWSQPIDRLGKGVFDLDSFTIISMNYYILSMLLLQTAQIWASTHRVFLTWWI